MSKELLSQFLTANNEFCAYAKTIPAQKMHQAPAPGEWSPAFVIHHMADSDAHFLVRFLNILSTDNPAIVPFDEDAFPASLGYAGRDVAVSIAALETSAAHLADIFNNVSDDVWNRTGVHAVRGEMTASALLELTVGHRVGHLEQLKK
jgi:DinB superfamily